jgi:sulfonate transport system ATP-binding protein
MADAQRERQAAPGDVELRAVHKAFRQGPRAVVALDGVSLAAREGEILSIVGASGCGKSTLLRIVAGLEREFTGAALVGGEPVAGPGPDRGLVFQEHRLLPWLTVEANVAFGVAHLPREERERTVREHVALVGLSGFEHSYPHQLSGGMSQRVAIARALAARPRVLLLDEPFGALDALTRIQMQEEVLRLWQAERTTLLLVTHDVDEALFLGDRVAVLSSRPGRIRAVLDVDLPRPRDRAGEAFNRLRRAIFRELFGDDPRRAEDFAI